MVDKIFPEMDMVSKYIQNLKMAVTANPRQHIKTFSPTQLETLNAINQTLQNTYKNTQISRSITRLQERLDTFDSETIFTEIHNDLTEKYNLAKEHYKKIEDLRKEATTKGKLKENDDCKKSLCKKLDEVVTTLIKDFTLFREEKYRLLDEIFLIRTNNHITYDLEDLQERVEAAIRRPELIYSDEYEKMFKIHVILDEEEERLKQLLQ